MPDNYFMNNQTQRYVRSINDIERLYDFLNKRFFESALSKPVITIQPDESCTKLGWFVPCRIWKDGEGYKEFEINISANYLDRSLEEVAGVLLHEMCHQYCYENHIKDTSRSGHYHNREFVIAAQTHGLLYAGEKTGDGYTELAEGTKSELNNEFRFEKSLLYRRVTKEDIKEKILHDALCNLKKKGYSDNESDNADSGKMQVSEEVFKRTLQEAEEKYKKSLTKRSSTRKYICEECRQTVRATKRVNIICGVCHCRMVESQRENQE